VNVRPENNVASLKLQIGDWQSKNYSDVFDTHTALQLDLKCAGNQTYTTTFVGIIHSLDPILTPKGEDLIVQAWGYGIALAKTFNDTTYGLEVSTNFDTFKEIAQDMVTNYVNKRFGSGGASTQWGIDNTDIDNVHVDFTINNLTSHYLDNFTLLNQLCDIVNAHANIDSDISVHWYVDTDKHLRVKEIDNDSADSSWKHYYGGSTTAATFKEGVNNIESRGFHKHINDYANHVLIASGFRKPSYDYWTEDGGPAWDNVDSADSYSLTQFRVGSHSLRINTTHAVNTGYTSYPASFNANWDLDTIGSEDTIPTLNMYLWTDDEAVIFHDLNIILATDFNAVDASGNNDYYALQTVGTYLTGAVSSKWYHISVPVGSYWRQGRQALANDFEWASAGNPDWGEIDFICFSFANVNNGEYLYVDDLHFSGKIIRSCYDTSAITATNKERQVFLRMDHAVDDTLVADDDDAGMTALLAVSELYRRTTTPVVGTLKFPCKEDMLPGQTLQVYAGLKPDRTTYRWSNTPMRIKKLTHTIDASGYYTSVDLTSDVTNTFASGLVDRWSRLRDVTAEMNHGQAKNLKVSGVDNKLPRLAWDPT
jgi:hypothetical protein